MLEMEIPGKKRRRRPQRRCVEVMREDMENVSVKDVDDLLQTPEGNSNRKKKEEVQELVTLLCSDIKILYPVLKFCFCLRYGFLPGLFSSHLVVGY